MADFSVYMHTFPNGKRYIGITCQKAEKRWGRGSGYKRTVVYNAIQKYGWDNIKHEILYTGLSQEQAEQKEQELIAKYQTADHIHGYNIALGGCHKGKLSKEQIEKLRKANIGRKVSEETRRKISEANKRRGPEERARLAEMSRNMTQETKDKISKSLTGKKQSEETKNKRADKLRGLTRSAEIIEKYKKAQNNRTPEWEEKRKRASRLKCNKKIAIIDHENKIIKEFNSLTECSNFCKVDISQISAVCRNKRKTAHGLRFKFI